MSAIHLLSCRLFLATFLLSIASFAPRVFGADARKIPYLGVRLGEAYSLIRNKLPCDNRKPFSQDFPSAGIAVECGETGPSFYFDRNQKLFEVANSLKFTSPPDWDEVIAGLVHDFGKPDVVGINRKLDGQGWKKTLCWGKDCKTEDDGNEYWSGEKAFCYKDHRSVCLEVTAYHYQRMKLDIGLYDGPLKHQNKVWIEREYQKDPAHRAAEQAILKKYQQLEDEAKASRARTYNIDRYKGKSFSGTCADGTLFSGEANTDSWGSVTYVVSAHQPGIDSSQSKAIRHACREDR